MADKRKIEIFSAGCGICDDVIAQVKQAACESCDVTVHTMADRQVADRATALGIRSLPAIVIDGKLAGCCADRGVDLAVLRGLGLGQGA